MRLIAATAFIVLASTAAGVARADDRAALAASTALAEPHPEKLGLFEGAGYLGSPGAHGATFAAGLRLALAEHIAASFDLGYGLLGAYAGMRDRWWVIPSLAFVTTAGRVRFDLGAGAGVGTSSGYGSWSDYAAAPFLPGWHYTVPAVRAHGIAAIQLSRDLDVFARADVASLLLTGPARPTTGAMDTTWVALWLGFQHRLL
jgi:hypothetical protein